MALSGDNVAQEERRSKSCGLRYETKLHVDANGKVVKNPENTTDLYLVPDVLQIVDGSLKDIEHLVGYGREQIHELLDDNMVLHSSDAVQEKLDELPPRAPGAFLVEDDGVLYGLIIDRYNELKIVGTIQKVVPGRHGREFRAFRLKEITEKETEGWEFCNPKEIFISTIIENGGYLGMVSLDGYCFLQLEPVTSGFAKLGLVLQNGYFFLERRRVIWTRQKPQLRIVDMEIGCSDLEREDCIVACCGAVVYKDNDSDMEVFGRSNAIVNYTALKEFLYAMGNVGYQNTTESKEGYVERPDDLEYQDDTSYGTDDRDDSEWNPHKETEEDEEQEREEEEKSD